MPNTLGNSTQVEQHFATRQQRREEQDRRLVEDTRRRLSEERLQVLRTMNESRAPEDHFTTFCFNCEAGINHRASDTWENIDGEMMCAQCVADHCSHCSDCDALVLDDNLNQTSDDRNICNSCRNNYSYCDQCDGLYHEDSLHDYNGDTLCDYCHSERASETENLNVSSEHGHSSYREYGTKILPKFCSPTEGAKVKHTRIFSAELETFVEDTANFKKVMLESPIELGASGDASICPDDYGTGIEFQTPRLQGKNGEEFISNLCERLNERNFKTNKTCGLHIHLDGGDDFITSKENKEKHLAGENAKTLFLFYLIFEDVLLSFLPQSRRKNQYCKPLKSNFHVSEIVNSYSLEELEKLWYRTSTKKYVASCKRESKHSSRYAGVNMHTLLSGNHLEIRYHSGTINKTKILEWVNLHGRIMDHCAFDSEMQRKILEANLILDLKEKTDLFFSLINLTPSSRKYFLKRQTKFMDKKPDEEGAFDETAN